MPDWRAALMRLEGAYADTTLRGYRADMAVFENWCGYVGRRALPASPQTVAAFVAQQAKFCSAATLKRQLAAIRKIHKLLRMENPVNDEEVALAMRRALRKRAARPRQALGLTCDLRDRLIAACPETLAGKRDRAMIALGYDTLCRRAELVALCVEDLTQSASGSAQILIRRSKNDPYGNGRLGYVSPETLELLRTWMKAANIARGYIFRAVNNETVGRQALHACTVNRVLKRAAQAAQLSSQEVQRLSGHSMRVGAAQDMIVAGLGILPIMQAGGWKSGQCRRSICGKRNLNPLLEKASPCGRIYDRRPRGD